MKQGLDCRVSDPELLTHKNILPFTLNLLSKLAFTPVAAVTKSFEIEEGQLEQGSS